MTLRRIEITAPADNTARIQEITEKHDCIDSWHSAKNKDGRRTISILTTLHEQQSLTDDLQKAMHKEENWRIVVQPVEATIPMQEEKEPASKLVSGSITREELYNEIVKGARTDFNFIMLVILSTIVCAIGLLTNSVAVIIGAMVIAPLLGPNLALAFGTALGDRSLIIESVKSNALGLGMTLLMATLTGVMLNFIPSVGEHIAEDSGIRGISKEIIDRTHVGYDTLALALASGAAAVLSMITGLSSTLVGVMVAVALMPPAVTVGLMLGLMEWDHAYGAALLLLANIVSISIAAQVVFLIKGIKPRTWYQRKKSKQSLTLSLAVWGFIFVLILSLITLRQF